MTYVFFLLSVRPGTNCGPGGLGTEEELQLAGATPHSSPAASYSTGCHLQSSRKSLIAERLERLECGGVRFTKRNDVSVLSEEMRRV